MVTCVSHQPPENCVNIWFWVTSERLTVTLFSFLICLYPKDHKLTWWKRRASWSWYCLSSLCWLSQVCGRNQVRMTSLGPMCIFWKLSILWGRPKGNYKEHQLNCLKVIQKIMFSKTPALYTGTLPRPS